LAGRFMATIAALDKNAIEALGAAFVGSGRPLVMASGTLLLPPGRFVTEHDTPDPTAPAAYRGPSEAAALALATREVRTAIVRLAYPPRCTAMATMASCPASLALRAKSRFPPT